MIRVTLTVLLVVIYALLTNAWMYCLANGLLTIKQNRLSFYAITGAMILLSYIDLRTMTDSYLHCKFNDVAFATILANFMINVANHAGIIGGTAPNLLLTFNGLIFANTIIIFTCMKRHGFLKD
jgi:hypothetical protein